MSELQIFIQVMLVLLLLRMVNMELGLWYYSQHRPWANNTSDIQIPEQWPDNFANNYMNGATTGFQYKEHK